MATSKLKFDNIKTFMGVPVSAIDKTNRRRVRTDLSLMILTPEISQFYEIRNVYSDPGFKRRIDWNFKEPVNGPPYLHKGNKRIRRKKMKRHLAKFWSLLWTIEPSRTQTLNQVRPEWENLWNRLEEDRKYWAARGASLVPSCT